MAASPDRRGGKRKSRRRVPEVNRRKQLHAWKTVAVNTFVAAPVYGTSTFHPHQTPHGWAVLLAALTGSALATWVNTRGGNRRR